MARKPTETPGVDDLEGLRSFLREEADKTPASRLSVYERIRLLLPEIDALFAKRRTRAEVCELLNSRGFSMSLGTFSQYYARAKRESEGEPDGERKPTEKNHEPAVNNEANTPSSPAANTTPSGAGTKPEEAHTPDLRPRNRDI